MVLRICPIQSYQSLAFSRVPVPRLSELKYPELSWGKVPCSFRSKASSIWNDLLTSLWRKMTSKKMTMKRNVAPNLLPNAKNCEYWAQVTVDLCTISTICKFILSRLPGAHKRMSCMPSWDQTFPQLCHKKAKPGQARTSQAQTNKKNRNHSGRSKELAYSSRLRIQRCFKLRRNKEGILVMLTYGI
jgi:hypothetical protein